MDMLHRIEDEVSAAEPNEGARWEEIGKEVTARLKAITKDVNRVLAQEGHMEGEVEYGELVDDEGPFVRWF